jgi:paraquat-inducible protein A
MPDTTSFVTCPRCQSQLYFRKPAAIERSWAYLISAYLLFGPAMMLPIMETGSLFGEQRDTIMSGILFLLGSGSWALAAIVFIASIFVPLAKLICLTYLLVTIHKGKPTKRLHRTRLYRMLEFVGRWSMLDVYVVTLLSVLVQLKGLANIYPMPGAMAFGAVVVLTMMATLSFDPRLIWDAALDQHQTIPESK